MSILTCPTCQRGFVRLLDISASVNYYCCDSCHHTWNVPKTALQRRISQEPMKRIGRITYEQRFVIMQVPAEWKSSDPLPEPSAQDEWFDKLADFEAALGGPWDRKAINRHPPAAPHTQAPMMAKGARP